MSDTTVTANQQVAPSKIGLKPFFKSLISAVLRPIADIATTIINLPRFIKILVNEGGMSKSVLMSVVIKKPIMNQGKILEILIF